MTFVVIARIAAGSDKQPPCARIADKLVSIGKGKLTTWQPETEHAPAEARFVFQSEHERDEFIAAAVVIPRVCV